MNRQESIGRSYVRESAAAPREAPRAFAREQPARSPNAPVKKFRAGPVSATVWNNQGKEGEGDYKTISFERTYKDKDGAWKTTSSLRMNDLPKAALVLQKAYEFLALGEDQEAQA